MKRSKGFKRGLIVGKFCPLHKGHELLIHHALNACELVTVISYTKPEFEYCDCTARESWLINLFPEVETLVIDDESLRVVCKTQGLPFREIPHNDAPDDIQREFVGWLCFHVLSHIVDVVFSSEDYGDGFAESLSIYFSAHTKTKIQVVHACVDKPRSAIPVSGTAVRSNPHAYRDLLSPVVYAGFVKRICLLGGESSGKTTLAQALAEVLSTVWVPEYGRELWEQKEGKFEYEDMLTIAREQVGREIGCSLSANEWLICDTSSLTTLFYSLSMFGKAEPELVALADRRYDHVFLCAPDFPFVQDGTRRDDEFRAQQHSWYMNELQQRKVSYEVLSGSFEGRISRVLELLA